MDGGKGGQTLRLQGREGENRKQSAKLRRKRKNGISRARAIPGKRRKRRKGGGCAGQKAHDGGIGESMAMAWPRRAELCRKQWWRY